MSGIIPVVAAAFTLLRLSRFNELTAVLAAGVPLLRVAVPIILAGVAVNVLMVADQELLIPAVIPQAHPHARRDARREARHVRDPGDAGQRQGAALLRPLHAAHGKASLPQMEYADVIERQEREIEAVDGKPAATRDRAQGPHPGRPGRLERRRGTDGT